MIDLNLIPLVNKADVETIIDIYIKENELTPEKKEKLSKLIKDNIRLKFNIGAEIYCKKFNVDNENDVEINQILLYLERNEKFNKQYTYGKRNINKGFLIIGNKGSGKTTILEICRLLLRQTPLSFRKLSTSEVIDSFSERGTEYLRELKDNIFFDDLGFEKPASHYADKRELMQDIIYSRYDNFRFGKQITHFTTNLFPQEIIDRYGDLIWSRLQEMCNIIIIGGSAKSTDRRINKDVDYFPDLSKFPRLYITRAEYDDAVAKKKMLLAYEKIQANPVKEQPKGIGTRLREDLGIISKNLKPEQQ